VEGVEQAEEALAGDAESEANAALSQYPHRRQPCPHARHASSTVVDEYRIAPITVMGREVSAAVFALSSNRV
jgi:hypothetical protein